MMGVGIQNIRHIVHLGPPYYIESNFQINAVSTERIKFVCEKYIRIDGPETYS